MSWERRIEADDRKGLEGLLAYMDRPPVSLKRLTYLPEKGLVHYQGTKLHPRLGTDHQLLSPVDFLALLVSHVLLRYEVTIRSYGAVSTTFRRRVGWIEAPPVKDPPLEALKPLPSPPPGARAEAEPAPRPSLPLPATPSAPSEELSDFSKKRRRNWGKLLAKVYLEDPSLYVGCGKELKIIAALTSPAQDDVIERVLRHMKLWDPPWKRERRACGPPTRAHATESCPEEDPCRAGPIDPDRGFEQYAIDPPWSEEL